MRTWKNRRDPSLESMLLRLCVAAVLLLASCAEEPPPAAPELRPVRFVSVKAVKGARLRTFSGTTRAEEEPSLSFKVPGTIVTLAVKVGDRVGAGVLIAELDPLDYQLQVEEAEAALARAQAEARNAEATFRRVRDLYENGNASRNEYDAARAAAESSRAQVLSVEKRLQLARRQLSYTRLTAPSSGAIAEVNVEVNENVGAGRPVALLTSSKNLEVEVTMPENLIAQVERGQKVSVTFDALPGVTLPAVVSEVGVASTGAGTTFPVRVRLTRTDPAILPGMAAEVGFQFGDTQQRRFLLPPSAVLEDREGRFVYVVEPGAAQEGVVRRRSVTVGDLTNEGLEVLTGLQEDDRVVTAGLATLSDGEKVSLSQGS